MQAAGSSTDQDIGRQGIRERIRQLPCWPVAVSTIDTLSGGITNQNFLVTAGASRYVVRYGGDIPVNHVLRFNEHAASAAAAAMGLSPPVRHAEADLLVIDYIPSQALDAATVVERLPDVVELMRRAHDGLMHHLRGPALSYWIFHVIRDNLHTLTAEGFDADLATLGSQNTELAKSMSAVQMVYCHNDWLPANILDDGTRLWLIDWDYAGFNSPLSDLASLAANNQFTPEQQWRLLEQYFRGAVDGRVHRDFLAMKAAALLKESLWSMVSQCYSTLDFDYAAYTRMNLARYHAAWNEFRQA